MSVRKLCRVGEEIDSRLASILVLLPIVFVISLYLYGSHKRHQENPKDRMMPNLRQIQTGIIKTVEVNQRTGDRWLWKDLKYSLRLMVISVAITVICAVLVGLYMACFSAIEALHMKFVRFVSFIPPLALLPLIFIFVGTDAPAKVLLIFLGTYFILVMDVFLACKDVPKKLIRKAYTMGASTVEVVFKVVLMFA